MNIIKRCCHSLQTQRNKIPNCSLCLDYTYVFLLLHLFLLLLLLLLLLFLLLLLLLFLLLLLLLLLLADTLQSRLQRKIQLKLDDAALEMMCSSYTRNQRLILSPADIQFLQPSPEHPSEVLSLILPDWIPNPHALFFYILQQLSSFFIKPQYTAKDGKWSRFEVPPVVEKVLNQAGLPGSIQQDLLFLYIRPVTRGRGIYVVCIYVSMYLCMYLLYL